MLFMQENIFLCKCTYRKIFQASQQPLFSFCTIAFQKKIYKTSHHSVHAGPKGTKIWFAVSVCIVNIESWLCPGSKYNTLCLLFLSAESTPVMYRNTIFNSAGYGWAGGSSLPHFYSDSNNLTAIWLFLVWGRPWFAFQVHKADRRTTHVLSLDWTAWVGYLLNSRIQTHFHSENLSF